MSRSSSGGRYRGQNFTHSSSAHSFSLPVPPPPPPPPSSTTSFQTASSTLGGVGSTARCRPCSVCSSAARYSLVLDQLQTCDLSATATPPTLTGNGTRPRPPPPPPEVVDAAPGCGKAAAASGTGRRGGRIVPGRCRGRTSTCSLVLLPMAALLSLQALWVANSWQVQTTHPIRSTLDPSFR